MDYLPTLGNEKISQMKNYLYPLKQGLIKHRVYNHLLELKNLQIFMKFHVFAVWDFMNLVKMLQLRLTNAVPWLPPANIAAARMINEIVLSEETDEITPGNFTSHFDLYLASMKDVGADIIPISQFIDHLHQGRTVKQALDHPLIPAVIQDFVSTTMKATQKSTHELAATFLFGREDVIPSMFKEILDNLILYQPDCQNLILYLQRHIQIDEEIHGPMGEQILIGLCGDDAYKWEQSAIAAYEALSARQGLWDEVMMAIEALS